MITTLTVKLNGHGRDHAEDDDADDDYGCHLDDDGDVDANTEDGGFTVSKSCSPRRSSSFAAFCQEVWVTAQTSVLSAWGDNDRELVPNNLSSTWIPRVQYPRPTSCQVFPQHAQVKF